MKRLTPDDLVDLEELRRLKHAYCRCVDTKDFAALGQLFVPDGTALLRRRRHHPDGARRHRRLTFTQAMGTTIG